MSSSKNTKNLVKFVYATVFLLLTFLLVFNLSVLSDRVVDSARLESEVEEINNILEGERTDASEAQESEDENTFESEPNTDYWNYLKIAPDKVNVRELKKLNSDTVGFLSISGTKVNYPVVQAVDNRYYLKHSFKKRENGCGWLFMDYRNSAESVGRNTIIYGHSNIDKTMFGSLSDMLSGDWVKNSGNGDITFVNLNGKSKWKIISVYTIQAESYYLQTDFRDEAEFSNWVENIAKRSIYSLGYRYSAGDKVMTLSTCYKDEGNVRLVVHAKQI